MTNTSHGGTGKIVLVIDDYEKQSGYFRGRAFIGDPLSGSGVCRGVLNAKGMTFAITPKVGVTNLIQFRGAADGEKITGAFVVPSSTSGPQKGVFSLLYYSGSSAAITSAGKDYESRVRQESQYFAKLKASKKIRSSTRNSRSSGQVRAVDRSSIWSSNNSNSTIRSSSNWRERERDRSLKRQADALERQNQLLQRESLNRFLQRKY